MVVKYVWHLVDSNFVFIIFDLFHVFCFVVGFIFFSLFLGEGFSIYLQINVNAILALALALAVLFWNCLSGGMVVILREGSTNQNEYQLTSGICCR